MSAKYDDMLLVTIVLVIVAVSVVVLRMIVYVHKQ